MTTQCPYGDEHCPVITGPPMKGGGDCQYCMTVLSPADVEALTPDQQRYLTIKRRVSPMRWGGPSLIRADRAPEVTKEK